MTRAEAVAVGALLLCACSAPSEPAAAPRARGPGRIRPEVVARHTRHLNTELRARSAGSQAEGAAAAYILGHLQRAGYVARLEAVPVADAVNSTDVISVPRSGGAPDAVVAVPYDAPVGDAGDGDGIGLFLELARALAVAAPDHAVSFAALGAERTAVGSGHLGARRLARVLNDQGHDPLVITIERVGGPLEGGFGAFGSDVDGLRDAAERLEVPILALPATEPDAGRELSGRAAVFAEAGLEHVAVTGGVDDVGRVLLEFLA